MTAKIDKAAPVTPDKIKLPRFTRGHVQKSKRLLDMLYKPSEIADELGIDVKTIYRTHMPAGCPHQKDNAGNIWIHGVSYAAWVDSIEKSSHQHQTTPMHTDEAYCVRCRHRVKILDMTSRTIKRGLTVHVLGTCAECGGRVSKITSEVKND